TELLLRAENRILRHLEDAELNHGFSGNFDLLLRLWIEPGASFPLLFYELPKSRHDEFAVLFGGFVGDVAERIKEYAGGLFIGYASCPGGIDPTSSGPNSASAVVHWVVRTVYQPCALKFYLGHLERIERRFIAREPRSFNKSKSSFARHSCLCLLV